MQLKYLAIFVALLLVLTIAVSNTRSPPKHRRLEPIPEPCDLEPSEPGESHFDLYEAVYDLMAKQTRYLQTLG